MKKIYIALAIAGVVVVLVLAAVFTARRLTVNQTAGVSSQGISVMMGRAVVNSDAYGAPTAEKMIAVPPVPGGGTGATAQDRANLGPKIIMNGSLTMRVDDAGKQLDALKQIAKEVGGYVSESHLSIDTNNIKTAYATLRLPVAKFDEAVGKTKKLAALVLDESSNSQDVTAQFVDLNARLKSAQAEEAQYMTILKQAKSIDDILNVTQRLQDVRSRIEQMQGELKYLGDQTDYATLNVTMTESARVQVPTRAWAPFETIKSAAKMLVAFLQTLVDILLIIVIFLVPVIIVLWLLIWIMRVIWRRIIGSSKRK